MSKWHKTAEGYMTNHYYTNKSTLKRGNCGWCYIERTLKRRFPTLEAAQKFAKGKCLRYGDIYRSKDKFVVEWIKIIPDQYGDKWEGIKE